MPSTLEKRLKRILDELRAGEPGSRFQRYHESRRRREGEPGRRKYAFIALGLVLVVVGTVASLPPGLPGFLLWVPGLGLVAARMRSAAWLLDAAEAGLRRLAARLGLARRG